MRFFRPAHLAAGAALVLASACLNDRPVAPRGNSALAMRIAAPAITGQTVEMRVYFFPYGDLKNAEISSIDLFDQTFHTDPGSRQLSATFLIAQCLPYFGADDAGPYCDVFVELTLRQDGQVIDRQTVFPSLRVRPGQITDAGSVDLGGNVPPQTANTPSRGVRVASDLVRYHVNGSDLNGDIIGMVAVVLDSSFIAVGNTVQMFDQQFASVGSQSTPTFYAYMNSGATALEYEANFHDAQGNYSEPTDAAGIDAPNAQTAPRVFEVSSHGTVDSVFFTAQFFSNVSPVQTVDFVVSNYGGGVSVDTIFQVCTLTVPAQSNSVAGGCTRQPGYSNVRVWAVPADVSGSWGFAYECDFGDSCNNSIIVPGGRKHR